MGLMTDNRIYQSIESPKEQGETGTFNGVVDVRNIVPAAAPARHRSAFRRCPKCLASPASRRSLLTDDIVPRAAASSNYLPPPWWAKRAAIRDPAGKRWPPSCLQGIAQNVARLFFHAAAVPSRAAFRPRGL